MSHLINDYIHQPIHQVYCQKRTKQALIVIRNNFNDRKYNAARTLEAFSATLRNEVDLASLREQLVNVVQETMQPASISL